MKERQRWRAEEDAILRAYVKQYGPREWNLISQRMNIRLERDAKSCLERWKNYLKPGIKKGSLTEEEQRLVIHLQSKHGNKWKKIAAEVPGRTAKRLGKWWEVFKEKQLRELKESNRVSSAPIEPGKYDRILESFAEKLVKQRTVAPLYMATPLLPPWLVSSNNNMSSPSVALSLSPSTLTAVPPAPWVPIERGAPPSDGLLGMANSQENVFVELVESCRELQEGYQAWAAQKKEAAWRLKRVELQLESEKASKRREKMEEMETKMRELREEQNQALERIEAECREQLMVVRRDAEAKEQKLVEMWSTKHATLSKLMKRMMTGHH